MPSRAELHKAAKVTPIEDILGAKVAKSLTPKQRKYAKGIAEGKTKASAYREAYPEAKSPNTLAVSPYKLAADPRIRLEVEAYALAIESARQRTPAALRELVIHGLVQVALDPEAKNGERIAALKTLGTVTEVAAFTERRETRTISSSDDARKSVMQELQRLMGANASIEDAKVISTEADELLRELAGTHPGGTPHEAEPESRPATHTIPPESSHPTANFASPSERSDNFTNSPPTAKSSNSIDSSDNFIEDDADNFCSDDTPPPQSGDTPR